MEKELGKIFNTVLSTRCRLLYHPHQTFEQVVFNLNRYLSSKSPAFPAISVKKKEYHKVYYFNNIDVIYEMLQNKVCPQLNQQQLNTFMSLAKRDNQSIDDIINDFIGFYYIKTSEENYETILSKLKYQRSLLQKNGYKKLQQQIKSAVMLRQSPPIPSRLQIINQLIIGLDMDHDVIMMQFEMTIIDIDIANDFFLVHQPKDLLDINYSNNDNDENIEHREIYNDEYIEYIQHQKSFVVISGLHDIEWKYRTLALSTVDRWNQIAITDYKN